MTICGNDIAIHEPIHGIMLPVQYAVLGFTMVV